jgi:2-dehydro-3-deoxyphosphogalactonate aldolase
MTPPSSSPSAAAFKERLAPLPLVAILRGLVPEEAVSLGATLVEAGFVAIEVPLNSPRPLDSIRAMTEALGDRAVIGAGTVLRPDDVDAVAAAGGRLVVAPNFSAAVVAAAKRRGLWTLPGVATPTEAFAALDAGADAIKLFPAEGAPPSVLKAWRAVLPRDAWVLPVGGISPERMAPYVAAGADGFGLGSALFTPGISASELRARAGRFAEAWRHTVARNPL